MFKAIRGEGYYKEDIGEIRERESIRDEFNRRFL